MIDVEQYLRTLGDELRRARRNRGWTRKQLQAQLTEDVSLQTLATYELGTRQCSVVRLAQLCAALDVVPDELLARVHDRVHPRTGLVVSLVRVIDCTRPELAPLRQWAKARSANSPENLKFEFDMLDRLAELCGLEVVELVRHLQALNS